MYVVRTVRKRVPIFQSTKVEDVLEIYYSREDKYGKGKYEIFDSKKEKIVDAEDLKRRHSSRSDTGVRESVSEDSDLSLYGAIGDTAESTTDSPD